MCNFEEKNQRFIFWTSLLALREAQTLPTPTPPEKKKKKRKKKELPFFYTFQKLEERHDISFYYIHFEITADPGNRIGSNRCDLFTRSTFFL